MAYSLYIERKNSPITHEEWKSAIMNTYGVRFTTASSATVHNPQRGEVISLDVDQMDVEVLFESSRFFGFQRKIEWIHCLSFSNGRGIFKATLDVMNQSNSLHKVVLHISKDLDAEIIGDEGEVYEW
jgi:hypothetical protein